MTEPIKSSVMWKFLGSGFLLLVGIVIGVSISPNFRAGKKIEKHEQRELKSVIDHFFEMFSERFTYCDPGQNPKDTEIVKDSIFDPPSSDEMDQIKAFLSTYDFSNESPDIILNEAPLAGPDRDAISDLFGDSSLATTQLSSPSAIWGGIMTTYISRIDTLPVSKAAALAYLDGSSARPDRYAKVNIAFGSLEEPYFAEYKVGPLSSSEMTAEKLSDQLWGSRPREGNEMRALKTMVDYILNEDDFKVICAESFAGKTHGNGLNNHEPAPPGLKGSERHTQILVAFTISGTWRGKDLNLVPLSFTINNTAQDPSMWTAYDFWYNYQGPFERDELVEKYNKDELDKIVIPESHFELIQESTFPQKRSYLPNRDFAMLPGPRTYMPSGPRYTVNGRTVKWMDWQVHTGYTFRAGPTFKNIKFKGDRIAYEVALNEVGLIYSANDPVAGNVFFLDSTFGNGEYRELMRGIDCPDYATYLTNSWWAAPGGTQTALRSTCIFETNTGDPTWRRGGPFVSGLPNTELHIRFAMPNGNYDYIVTYKFSLDGHLRTEIGSTGYIQTHFMPSSRNEKDSMAYRVQTYTGGQLHDHTYGFKVDLDVLGSTNTFKVLEYKTGSTLDAINAGKSTPLTEKPGYLLFDTMRYVEETVIENENDAILNVDPMKPKEWLFGDTTKKNKWDNFRAYKILIDQNPNAVVHPESHTLPAFNYAKHMLAVTAYKEEEETITGPYDLNRLDDPQGNFDRMVDGDSIIQEDLVAWITLCSFHLPTAEDIPMVNTINHGFTLSPHNFFDENPSMDMPHYLRMHPGEEPDDTRSEDLPVVPECVPNTFDTTHTFAGV